MATLARMTPLQLATRIGEFLGTFGQIKLRTRNSIYLLREVPSKSKPSFMIKKLSDNVGEGKPIPGEAYFGDSWGLVPEGDSFYLRITRNHAELMHTSRVVALLIEFE